MYKALIIACLVFLLIPILLGCEGATDERTIIRTIETEEGIYRGEIKNGLPHGEGYFEYFGLGSYEGGFAEGEFHGYGVFDVPGFFKYEGEFYEGEYHGYGIETWADGDRYEGEWYQGEKHGEGTETWTDGTSYTGSYQDGYRDGEGLYTWTDGRTYEGEFSRNVITGFGTMTFPEGLSFTGNWDAGLMSGEGKWVYESGATYSGEFEEGYLLEEGKWTINGNEYEEYFTGEYRNDLPYGDGKRYYADGTKAIGTWDEQGKATDYIVFFYSSGVFYEGEISAGFPEGWGKYHSYLHDFHYEGELKADLRHGQGTYYYGDTRYEGEWQDHQRHGQGTHTYADGRVYEGEWQENQPYGQGRFTHVNGRVYEGGWKAGLRHGQGTIYDSDGNILHEGLWENGEHISGKNPASAADYFIDYNNGTIPLSEVEIGARVVDLSWDWEFRTGHHYRHEPGDIYMPVTWIVVAHDHYDLDEGHVTLLSEELIGLYAFDNSTNRGDDWGSDHWGDSGTPNADRGLRPWLNSTGIHEGEGFYNAFSASFKSSIITTTVPNKEWEEGGAYNTSDNVFIPSTTELGDILHDRTYEIGSTYPYFQGAGDEERIAKLFGETQDLWTRSPAKNFSYFIIIVASEKFSSNSAHLSNGVRPALNLKSDIMVSEFSD
jgi:hypothetical protein